MWSLSTYSHARYTPSTALYHTYLPQTCLLHNQGGRVLLVHLDLQKPDSRQTSLIHSFLNISNVHLSFPFPFSCFPHAHTLYLYSSHKHIAFWL